MSELLARITTDPNRMHGRPCIRGLRITVADVLDLLAAGQSREKIRKEYPYLEDADIGAALAFDERIETNLDIMDGKPVIRGTRVPVELVLRKLGVGMSPEAILIDHPRLTLDDIRAAQALAADYLADE
jgi:uncharacterized protein (DUF433 family)